MNPSGETRAFRRGVRIAAGFAALLVAAIMVVIVQRDRPLKVDTHLNAPAVDRAAMQASDNGPLPRAGDAPANRSDILRHPVPGGSDLSPRK